MKVCLILILRYSCPFNQKINSYIISIRWNFCRKTSTWNAQKSCIFRLSKKGFRKTISNSKIHIQTRPEKISWKTWLKGFSGQLQFLFKKVSKILLSFFLEKRAKVAENLSRIVFLLLRSLLLINQSTQFVCTTY